MNRRGPMPGKRRSSGRDQHHFVYEDDPLYAHGKEPYLCNYYHPIPVDRLRTIPKEDMYYFVAQIGNCLMKQCNNGACLLKANQIQEKHLRKTQYQVLDLSRAREMKTVTHVQKFGSPVVKEKKKVVEHHLPPELIKDTVDKHVYLPDPEPAVQKTKIIRHVEPERTKKVVNEHVYLQDPEPAVQKTKIIRHVEPKRTKNIVNEHVYLPEPVVETEHRVYYHQSSGGGQAYSASHVSYHDYGESWKSAEKKAEKAQEYDSNDTKKYSSQRKGKGERRENDYSEEEKKYSGKGKGKQKNDRDDKRDVSRRGSHDRKRSTSRSRRHNRDNRSSKTVHSARPRSRARSRSRRRSPHSRSPSADTQKRPSTKKLEKSRTREPEPHISGQDDNDNDDDAYYGSDTNNSGPKVPPPSTREIKAPPHPPPASSFDPYAALGLQDKRTSADQVDIDAAYKFLVRKWHPDRHMNKPKEEQDKATERTAELNRANDILGHAGRRKVFDRTGKTELWELDQLVEKEAKAEMAVGRPVAKGLKNFFDRQ
ncbi:DnaJ-domain-containing protein [Karstenula rhodostoma CBS 690.94]|uniref:DnaJ-domain-containing protein n=1 Tax=Karstenula rhodostoma CBS 690.94 TaxID=1392251 RepID=A0A9P4UG47_9PLEO|nr:DnaJ-domain-containing protein [Karstenula rhodostoma CBS 690.94]